MEAPRNTPRRATGYFTRPEHRPTPLAPALSFPYTTPTRLCRRMITRKIGWAGPETGLKISPSRA